MTAHYCGNIFNYPAWSNKPARPAYSYEDRFIVGRERVPEKAVSRWNNFSSSNNNVLTYTFRVQMGYAMGAFDFGHFDNNGDWVIDYDSDRMWSLYKKQWTPEKILMGATIAVSVLTVAQKTCPAYQQSITVVESAAAKGVPINRLNHIFGKSEHALESLVTKFGSQEGAFNAVQNAANQALKAGKLTPNAEGILPAGDLGNIINVGGMDVRLIGGRVENGQVILSSFSRKGF
jgi:hypothetical protein